VVAPVDVVLVVDVANVMGSRPDGWWRDRAGAAARLLTELAPLAGAVESLRAGLDELHAALIRGDADALHRFFAAARDWWRESEEP